MCGGFSRVRLVSRRLFRHRGGFLLLDGIGFGLGLLLALLGVEPLRRGLLHVLQPFILRLKR